MNNKKLNTILYIVVFVFVFIMFAVIAYAYYKKVIKKDENVIETNNFNMMVTFDDTNIISGTNLKSGFVFEKEFTVENLSEDTIGKYNVTLEIVTPLSNMVDEDFIYTLEGESESKDTTNKVVNVPSTPIPVLSKTIGNATITPKNTHTYKITVKLNNNKYAKDSLFTANVKITADN